MSLSVTSDRIKGSLLNAHNESSPGPLMYLIVGPYSSNGKIHQSTIYFVKISYVRFLWSIYIVIWCPNIMVWNYFSVSNIINSTISVVV